MGLFLSSALSREPGATVSAGTAGRGKMGEVLPQAWEAPHVVMHREKPEGLLDLPVNKAENLEDIWARFKPPSEEIWSPCLFGKFYFTFAWNYCPRKISLIAYAA